MEQCRGSSHCDHYIEKEIIQSNNPKAKTIQPAIITKKSKITNLKASKNSKEVVKMNSTVVLFDFTENRYLTITIGKKEDVDFTSEEKFTISLSSPLAINMLGKGINDVIYINDYKYKINLIR